MEQTLGKAWGCRVETCMWVHRGRYQIAKMENNNHTEGGTFDMALNSFDMALNSFDMALNSFDMTAFVRHV